MYAVLMTASLFATAAVLFAPPKGAAQPLPPLSVIAFPGIGTWPIRIAQEKGFFARNGIEVNLSPTPNSVFQITSLVAGKFDIAMTAADNVVAYVEGQGEVPLDEARDLFMFMGGSPSLPVVASIPEIKDYPELRGKTLAVDALTTGYAFVLFDLLKRNGLQASDYRIESAGGTLARWQGMRERKYAAAVLTSPFDLMAQADGFNLLQYARDAYGHYEESVATTRRAWALVNEDKIIAYVRAYVSAVEWLREAANKDEAISILRKHFSLSPQLAAGAYTNFLGSRGIAARAQLDLAGLRKVLELRSEYRKPHKSLTDPMRYYDAQYYDRAVR
jgi:ABC-type nitrate/sulfonate/bicarbonate transport system substrate-binding protein